MQMSLKNWSRKGLAIAQWMNSLWSTPSSIVNSIAIFSRLLISELHSISLSLVKCTCRHPINCHSSTPAGAGNGIQRSFICWKQGAIYLPVTFSTYPLCGFRWKHFVQKFWWHLVVVVVILTGMLHLHKIGFHAYSDHCSLCLILDRFLMGKTGSDAWLFLVCNSSDNYTDSSLFTVNCQICSFT